MLIVGLGNPGKEYIGTRHNIGRDFLLELAEKGSYSDWKLDRYLQSLVSSSLDKENEEEVVLALPETFMNRSGEVVRSLIKKLNLRAEELVVVYDDLDLPVGTLKVSVARGAGGHNGVRSVIDHLGSNGFTRIRIGICPVNEVGEKIKPHKDEVKSFVLTRFSPSEKELLHTLFKKIPNVIQILNEKGVDKAMNLFNTK